MNFGDFTLKITSKEMALEHAGETMWQQFLMQDAPFDRMNDRNMPYLELTNDADSTAPLTELRLTIGDERFHFDDNNLGVFALAASTTKEFSLTSSTLDVECDELIVKIGAGGLQPGEMVRFKIDLAVDAELANQFFAHPDFRTVLFDMNGVNVYDGFLQQTSSQDNAQATAIFDPASGANFTVGPMPFADALVVGTAADFFNNNYRRYRDSDPVRTFLLGLSAVAIPEPGSALLAAIGLVGGMIVARRSRRAARAAY